MASILSVFSSAFFFLLPVFSLLGFSRCKLTRFDLVSVVGLGVFGLLGIAVGVSGIFGFGEGLGVILYGFCELTTSALLVGSIYKSNQNRARSIVSTVNLAVYAVSMSLLVISGTVLSLYRKPSLLLGPLCYLLSATAALPLLVYAFLASSSTNDVGPSSTEDVDPMTPITPRRFQSHLTLPLSPSFLSLSSPPPSPCSNHTFAGSVHSQSRSIPTKAKKCASLDLPSTHSIEFHKPETNPKLGAKKFGARPATAPISSKEKKIRPRPVPLDLSLQLGTGTGPRRALLSKTGASSTLALDHRQRQAPTAKKFCLKFCPSKNSKDDLTSTTNQVWTFLLIAQIVALLVEGLRICAQVILAGRVGNARYATEPVSVAAMQMLANVFYVVQVGCVMRALMMFRLLLRQEHRTRSVVASITIDRPVEFTSTNHLCICNNQNSFRSHRASTVRTDSFPTSLPIPEFNVEADREVEDLTRLDRDLRSLGIALNISMDRETDLEALDLALPLTPISDSSLEPSITPPLTLSIKTKQSAKVIRASPSKDCQSMSASVHDGADILRDDHTPIVSLTGNTNGPGQCPDKFESFVLQVAEAPEVTQSKSTVVFPTSTSLPVGESQIQDTRDRGSSAKEAIPVEIAHSSSSRSRKERTQSFGGRSTKHGHITSIPSISSFSPSMSKSRLRSISLTGKSTRRTLSSATASIMDWGSIMERGKKEKRDSSPVSLSRSSSFCSPRPKRRALPGMETEDDDGEDKLENLHPTSMGSNNQAKAKTLQEGDVFSSKYQIPRARRPDALFADHRTLSPLPFASYLQNTTAQMYDCNVKLDESPPSTSNSRPLRPTRSSTFHIFPNFDALAGLGSLGVKLSRGLNRSPTPTRVLNHGAGRGVVMRSPTPKRMGGIVELTKAAITDAIGTAKSPSRSGIDLLRMEGALKEEAEEMTDGYVKQDVVYGRGWRRVDFEEKEDPFDVKLYEMRTPKRSRQVGDNQGRSLSTIPRFDKWTPGSLKSDTSSDAETTPGLPTPRTHAPSTPSTPVSPLRKLTRSSQPFSDKDKAAFNPILAYPLPTKLASPPPTSFNNSRFISQRKMFYAPAEAFNNDPDPFAAPELGAIVRESQVSLLKEDYMFSCRAQTATRMSAWGNLTLPVPKEKRNPGIGLRRGVSDSRIDATPSRSHSAPSGVNDLEIERPDSPSAYSQDTTADYVGSLGLDVEPAVDRAHRGSRASISLVPVEEALLAQKLLRRLDRRAEDRSPAQMSTQEMKHETGKKLPTGAQLCGAGSKQEDSEKNTGTPSGSGRSFLLGMSRGKFLGYGRR